MWAIRGHAASPNWMEIQSEWIKRIRCNPMNQWQLDMWHERTILLTQVDQTSLGEGGKNQPRKRERGRIFRERDSRFSLKFLEIRPSNLGEPRDKVAFHGKSYAWIPVLWSFDNSGR